MVFASYSAAVFVIGGSGITFALAAIQDLIQKDLNGRSRVKVIELIWVIQDPGSLSTSFSSLYLLNKVSLHCRFINTTVRTIRITDTRKRVYSPSNLSPLYACYQSACPHTGLYPWYLISTRSAKNRESTGLCYR